MLVSTAWTVTSPFGYRVDGLCPEMTTPVPWSPELRTTEKAPVGWIVRQ